MAGTGLGGKQPGAPGPGEPGELSQALLDPGRRGTPATSQCGQQETRPSVRPALNRNDPGKNYEVKIVLRPLHFGIGIRRGQADLLQWLNTFVYTIKSNGELDAISRKWRQLPLEAMPVF